MIKYTKFEKARILGARALQISQGAPTLVETTTEKSSIKIAMEEYKNKKIPLTVKRKDTTFVDK